MEPTQINIQIEKTLPTVCEKCGNDVFYEGLFLRKVSKFLTGSGKDSIIPIPTFACAKCNHVNEEFIPEVLKPAIQNEN